MTARAFARQTIKDSEREIVDSIVNKKRDLDKRDIKDLEMPTVPALELLIGLKQPFSGTKRALIQRIIDWKYDCVHGPQCDHLDAKGRPDVQWGASAEWRWARCRKCHRQIELCEHVPGSKAWRAKTKVK